MPHRKFAVALVACSLACLGRLAAATVAEGGQPSEPPAAPANRLTDEGRKRSEVLIYRSQALDRLIARTMHDKTPPATRLKEGLVDARLFDNRVLIFAASKKSDPCERFFSILLYGSGMRNGDEEAYAELGNFTRLAIDAPAQAGGSELTTFLERWHLAAPAEDDAVLAVVAHDGKLVAATTAAHLWPDKHMVAAPLTEFLRNHKAPVPDAQKRLADALAQARRENKRVLVQEGANWCPPCHALARYFDRHRSLVDKDYVWVTLDARLRNEEEVIRKLRPKQRGGIPWVVILDADGTPLITSDGSEGPIGYPTNAKDQQHFEKMLRTTARHLSDAEIKILLADFVEK